MQASKPLKILCYALLLLLAGIISYWLLLHNYASAIGYFAARCTPVHDQREYLLQAHKAPVVYSILRVIVPALTILVIIRFWLFLSKGKAVICRNEDLFFEGIITTYTNNRSFIKGLKKADRRFLFFLLGGIVVLFTYLMLSLPYTCDEAASYNLFSGQGFWQVISYYLLPNNHVFFNLVSYVFQKLPFDLLFLTRLPALLAALLSVYYFFKLCYRIFSPKIGLLSTALCVFSYPFAYYAVTARGYSFVSLCCILCIYSIACIMGKEKSSRYFFLYTLSACLGLYSIPVFLYCLAPLSLFLALYILLKERSLLLQYIVSHIILVAGTCLLYSPILLLSSYKVITANPFVKNHPYVKGMMVQHLQEAWHYLLGVNISLYWVAPVILCTTVVAAQRRRVTSGIAVLILLMLFAPFAFIPAMNVMPYLRNWSFMVIPQALSAGMMIVLIQALLKIKTVEKTRNVIAVTMLIIIPLLGTVNLLHVAKGADMRINYVGRDYVETLRNKMHAFKSIEYSYEGAEFITVEYLKFEAANIAGNKAIPATVISAGQIPQADLLIIDTANVCHFPVDNYDQVAGSHEFYKVYLKKGL